MNLSSSASVRLSIVAICAGALASCQLTRDFSSVHLHSERPDASTDAGTDPITAPPSDTRADARPQTCPTPGVAGEVLYVSPDGAASGAGTEASPWDPPTAADEVGPGDTVLFLPGEYTMSFEPATSGRESAPIVLRSAVRHGAHLVSRRGNAVGFRLQDRSHIRIEGFKFGPSTHRWVDVINSDHIVLSDLWMQNHDGVGLAVRIYDSHHVSLVDSIIRRSYKYVIAAVRGSDHIRLAGNSWSMTADVPLEVRNSEFVVVRANVFHNQVGRAGLIQNDRYILFENNVVTNSAQGPGAAAVDLQVRGDRIIFRGNRIFRNWGTPLRTELTGADWTSRHVRAYHNVIEDTRDRASGGGEGWLIAGGAGSLRDVVVQNNVFWRNRGGPDHIQLKGRDWNGQVAAKANAFGAGNSRTPHVWLDNNIHTVPMAEHAVDNMTDNLVADPGYLHPDVRDYQLGDGSPLIDAGQPLARTRSDGAGAAVPVDDSMGFYDGYGMGDELGDIIAVGDRSNRARITDIDTATHTLLVDRSLTWSQGDAVHLPWSGQAPDIGPREHGLDAAEAVGIDRSQFLADTHSPVTFNARIAPSIHPARIEWRLGDGSMTCGQTIEHTYDQQGDYAVRLKVIDQNGRVLRAASYLLVDGAGVDVDSIAYNKRLMDEYLCNGAPRPYNDETSGLTHLGTPPQGQGFICVP